MTRERLWAYCEQGVFLSLMALLMVVPLVFCTWTHDVFETNKIVAFFLLLLLATWAWSSRVFLLGDIRFKVSRLWLPVAMVGVSSILSTVFTNNRLTSLIGVYEDYEGVITILGYILLWLLTNQVIRNLGDIKKSLMVIALAGFLVAGYGLAQNAGIDFVRWNPTTYNEARFFGSLGNPNFLAAYLLMSLPITMMLFLTAQRGRIKSMFLVGVGMMVIVIFFTKSRGAFYGLMVEGVGFLGYLLYLIHRRDELWKNNQKWLVLLVLLACSTLALPSIRATMTTTVERTWATLDVKHIQMTPRLFIWRSALQMIKDHPWVGSGLDTFQITFPKYRLAEYWRLEWNGTPEKAHNMFLQLGATTGLVGLFAWLWMIGGFFVLLFRIFPRISPFRQHLLVGIALAQIGFLVQNQANFTVVAYGSLFWFLLALGPALDREESDLLPVSEGVFSLTEVTLKKWVAYIAVSGLILIGMVYYLRVWTADLYFKRAVVLMMQGSPQRSINELGRAVALNPQREIYWVKYGIAFEEAAKWVQDKVPFLKQAAEVHKYTQKMNPLNGYDANNLGRVYKYWGDFVEPAKLKEAEAAFTRATQLDPYNVYFALDLASVYLSEKRFADAEAVADRLISLFPDFAVPFSYKGYVGLSQGDQEKAFRSLKAAAELNWRGDVSTQASTLSNLGIVYARRGELEASLQTLVRALELRPAYLEARMNKALILEQLGRRQEAANEYRYIVKQAPSLPQAKEFERKIELLERGTDTK